MLSLFRGKKTQGGDKRVAARKSKKGESPFKPVKSREVKDTEGKIAQDIVLNTAERQLYKYELPQLERGFGDLLDAHDGDGTFPYAAITNKPAEGYDARMRRLNNLQPRINVRRMDVPDFVSLKFYKEVEEFPLSSIIQMEGKKALKGNFDYILIKRVSIIFSPLSSFVDTHSDVIVTLMDMRKRTDQSARSIILQDNKQYKGEFALDYCFPKISADKVSMSFAQEVPTFDTGEQWGACQLFLDLEESDYPQMASFQDTIGSASLTTSMMENYKYNPAHINLAIRNSHRGTLQDMYLQGQIADETEPMKDRTRKTTYARSSGVALKKRGAVPGKVEMTQGGDVNWSQVRDFTPLDIPEDMASIEPDDEYQDEILEDGTQPRGHQSDGDLHMALVTTPQNVIARVEQSTSSRLTAENLRQKDEGRVLKSALKKRKPHFSPSSSGATVKSQDNKEMGSPDTRDSNTGVLIPVGRLNQVPLRD
jgi:hypothetical protein